MSRFELITPLWAKTAEGQRLPSKQQSQIKKFIQKEYPSYQVHSSIEQFLKKLMLVNDYEDIPETVRFSYKNLIDRNIDFNEVVDLVNLTAKLAANKFNKTPKEILFTGFGSKEITQSDQIKLVKAGFQGCVVSPRIHGFDAAAEAGSSWRKDPTYWCPIIVPDQKIIIPKSTPIEITLTYRQQQIADMISQKGLTNYQIAKRLGISESTVKMHIGIILKKYAVQHRTQLTIAMKG